MAACPGAKGRVVDGPGEDVLVAVNQGQSPYFHNGRSPALDLLLGTKLTSDEKKDLVSFLRCL
jgi:hypothetical protein